MPSGGRGAAVIESTEDARVVGKVLDGCPGSLKEIGTGATGGATRILTCRKSKRARGFEPLTSSLGNR